MAPTARPLSNDNVVDNLALVADLPMLAEELGMRVISRGSKNPKALCPFHDDQTPSLNFYPGEGTKRGQYHCFACGAHGDVFGLVMRLKDCDFRSALLWIADRYQQPLPTGHERSNRSLRAEGLELAFSAFSKQSTPEKKLLRDFAEAREFASNWLEKAEVFGAVGRKLTRKAIPGGREGAEALREAGVLQRGEIPTGPDGVPLALDLPWRDFFSQDRVLFTLRDDRGRVAGFAGRALSSQDSPKYLYTPGFKTSETLYRFDRARNILLKNSKTAQNADLFVVEGLLDALRLESLNFPAVAVFGSQISAGQAKLLNRLADELDRDGRRLSIHLFLDADDPGRAGLRRSLSRLLTSLLEEQTQTLAIDVISPPTTAEKRDPDSLLCEVKTHEDAQKHLAAWNAGVLEWLLADSLEIPPEHLPAEWPRLAASRIQRAHRSIERLLPPENWPQILTRYSLAERVLAPSNGQPPEWSHGIEEFLRARRSVSPISQNFPPDRSNTNKLQHAMRVAKASGQRRELPVDEGSWPRLEAAIEIAIPALIEELRHGRQPEEPFVSTLVPRSDAQYRPKALPSPESLTMQQYILNELLRDFPEVPLFAKSIPAVRSLTGRERGHSWTTGPKMSQETVAFAYQLDMDIIEARRLPEREGMFRPYSRCWSEFISFIDKRTSEFHASLFHVARVDIRRYYCTLPRSVVIAALLEPLRTALHAVAAWDTNRSAVGCAPCFAPQVTDPDARAQRLVDWLCDQCFQIEKEDPKTGERLLQQQGVPQGPDLCAYLANIALFPLDQTLQKLVESINAQAEITHGKGVRGAVYARYVDDMVLVATTPHDLARMRATVENGLSALGLTISPKTEELPAMSYTELRRWLTEKRGLALGASGPFAGPPTVEPLGSWEPLADAGEIDRSDSLLVLHAPSFTDPETAPEQVIEAVRVALRGENLRHGDKARAAQGLWICAAQSHNENVKEAACSLSNLWNSTAPYPVEINPSKQSKPCYGLPELLAWLDGLERLLCSRPERNPSFSPDKQERALQIRQIVARWTNQGICEQLANLVEHSAQEQNAHMIRLRKMAILRASLMLLPEHGVPHWFKKEAAQRSIVTHAECRLLISIAESCNDAEFLTRARLHPDVSSPWLLLHEATARLIIATRESPPKQDTQNQPVTETVDPLEALRSRVSPLKSKDFHFFLTTSLEFLTPDFSRNYSEGDNKPAQAAARMLSTLDPRWLNSLFRKRQPLTEAVLGHGGEWTGVAIATPPGLNVPGLLGVKTEEQNEVVRVDFRVNSSSVLSPLLTWTQPQAADTALQFCKADLGIRSLLRPRDLGAPFTASQFPRLARAFRCLAKPPSSTTEPLCPVTPVNVLGPDLNSQAADREDAVWEPLGYQIPLEDLRGHAFVRNGSGLTIEWVAQRHDNLWRAGTALADLVGRGSHTRSFDTQRFGESSNTLRDEDDWGTEAMLRYCLTRLRGTAFPSRSPISRGQEFPASIERVLKRMESFPIGNGENASMIAHLFATLAEGRALYASTACEGYDWTSSGGPAALLADLAPSFFRVDEMLAYHLPRVKVWPEKLPKRRPTLAWLAVAVRIDLLVNADRRGDVDPTLTCVAASARLLALQAEIRAQALEQWARLSVNTREQLRAKPPSPGEAWRIDASSLLQRSQGQMGDVGRADANVLSLFDTLADATKKGAAFPFQKLESITPLGWLVVLGTLTSAFKDSAHAGTGALHAELLPELHRELGDLAAVLAANGSIDGEPPWDWVEPFVSKFGVERAERAFSTLARLDFAMGAEIVSSVSSLFRLIPIQRQGVVQYSSEHGTFELPAWQVQFAKVRGERGNVVENHCLNGEVFSHFVETRSGGRLLGLSVIQPHLAILADLTNLPEQILPDPTPLETEPELNIGLAQQSIPPLQPVSPEPIPSPSVSSQRSSASRNYRAQLEQLQQREWSKRSKKAPRHARVAFFQWDVDDSYRHPLFDACHADQSSVPDPEEPGNWKQHEQVPSCAEERRRELLIAALRACRHFEVNILLLPEYSIRPDTAKWLREVLPNLAPNTSVWAGTYRVPGKSVVDVAGDQLIPGGWSAIMPVFLQDEGQTIRVNLRQKKYPSVAAGEIFRPEIKPLQPVFRPLSMRFDPRNYVTELICSEVFLATSPANIHGTTLALRALADRFSIPELSRDDLLEIVSKDILNFGKYCSLSGAPEQPRLILLVPAMTARTADYAALGQASFLASSITTVFCNAVSECSRGESCIIGHDGWGIEAEENSGLPQPGPYHGALPGIYQPTAAMNAHNLGRLGKKEQALVIADIDPVYSPEGKPRPQVLPPPLCLVAHLPLIESGHFSNPSVPKPKHLCRCQHSLIQTDKIAQVAIDILERIKRGRELDWRTTADDSTPASTGELLGKLAELIEAKRPGWLFKRKDFYIREHLANPLPWPPPALIDWLWVERQRPDGNFAKLDTPPYSM
ncbi:CHC2 zinc finger domain-containing protein [Prosthecobacter sp.]|uniref:CHC2 zinc finger domain-containing protein n=1 Tax=Prosthecobacter sp. TaxID=1965333 RepID=UPI003783F707